MPTQNFRLSCLVTMVTILLGSHLSSTSARYTDKNSRLQTRINKRDAYMGLELHCKLHPRNCPGGYMAKRGPSALEIRRQLYPQLFYNNNNNNNDKASESDFGLEERGRSSSSSLSLSDSRLSSDSSDQRTPMGTYPAAAIAATLNQDDRVLRNVLDLLQNVRRKVPTYNNKWKSW